MNDYFPPEAKAAADRDGEEPRRRAARRSRRRCRGWARRRGRRRSTSSRRSAPKIGYPDVWRDYSALTIDRGPFVLNVQRADEFEFRRQLTKVGKPVDREDWQMTPPEVNAYYDPQLNEIVFPAGILQPPFFDREGRRRRQLRRHGRGHRPRDDARLRRRGPQVRRAGQHERLVDGRGRPRTTRRGPSASRSQFAAYTFDGPARQRQARPGRIHRGSRRPVDRATAPTGATSRGQARAGADRRPDRRTSDSSSRGRASGRRTCGRSSPSS